MLDEAYDELAIDSASSVPGLSSTNMQKWGNRYAKNFISQVDLKSREGTTTFTSVSDTSLNDANADTGDVTITITDATGWPAAGLALVDSYPMTFTRSGSVLTVTALPRDFDDGVVVQLAYALPTDFLRPVGMFVDSTEYFLAKKGNQLNPGTRSVIIYGDYFILPVGATGASAVTVHYMKKGSNTLTTADNMEIMDYFDSYVISLLAARGHRLMYDEDRAQIYEKQAREVLMMAKSHFAKADGGRSKAFIPGF